jgi:transposase InsO family protein
MKKLHFDRLLTSFDFESYETCEAFLLSKMTKAPFMSLPERALDLLELIHIDVCGPMSMTARGGFQYFITFIDDFIRYGYLYLMKHMLKSLEKSKEFLNEMENQRDKKIKTPRSNRGGEYVNHEFSNHLKSSGIVPHHMSPGTPQRNGCLSDIIRLFGYGSINDEVVRPTFVILEIRYRNSSFHTKYGIV